MAARENMERLRSKRGIIKGQLTRLENFIQSRENNLTLIEIETRLSVLRSYNANFEIVQAELEEVDDSEALKEDRGKFEETSMALEDKLLSLKERLTPNLPEPHAMNTTIPNQSFTLELPSNDLPPARVPVFSGNYLDWPSFKNQFDAMIHNNSKLPNTRKMAYLMDALHESVKPTINRLTISDENYVKAREILTRRFDRKRLIFEAFVKKLWSLPSATDPRSLRVLFDGLNAQMDALKLIADSEQIADGILIMLILKKVDEKSLTKWEEMSASDDNLPKWDDFVKFLERRCITLEAVEFASFDDQLEVRKASPKKNYVATKPCKCLECGKACKSVQECPLFLALSPKDRSSHARKLNLCLRCLEAEFNEQHTSTCNAHCEYCDRNHHGLLHWGSKHLQNSNVATVATNSIALASAVVTESAIKSAANMIKFKTKIHHNTEFISFNKTYTFLGTAYIKVKNSFGQFVTLRAMFDGGAQMNFITAQAAELLQLKGKRTSVEMSGVHGDVKTLKKALELEIFSKDMTYNCKLWAVVNPYFKEKQPSEFIDVSKWDHLNGLQLADEKFNIPHKVDIILNSHCAYGWQLNKRMEKENYPMLQETLLGWVVVGNLENACTLSNINCNYSISAKPNVMELLRVMKRLWEIEELPKSQNSLSKEEAWAVKHFYQNVTRNPAGRIIVKQCFKKNPEELGSSYGIALRRLYSLERQMHENPELAHQVHDFIDEYVKLGHCEKVNKLNGLACFIPYFYVLNPTSTTTSLRIVFDASCATESGESLNDILVKGPVIQDTLFMHLVRFQLSPVALGGDICKMYRQLLVHEDDRRWQCILYRRKPSDKAEIYKLNTVTYGLVPSSYQATQALAYLADLYKDVFPLGSQAVKEQFYMDDNLMGAETPEKALELLEETKNVLQKGGMQLRKICSNSKAVMDKIPIEERGEKISFEDRELVKTLGHWWVPEEDVIVFHYEEFQGPITVRTVISETAKIFDPLGKILPITMKLKMFMQHVTSTMKQMDAPLPFEDQKYWANVRKSLLLLNQIKVPRYALVFNDIVDIQIHGCADASLKGYSGAIYLRTMSPCGRIGVRHLCGRGRVAPLKTITLPRLELMAALTLTKLYDTVRELLEKKISFSAIHFWVDAAIVHSWIKESPHKNPPFVGCRVTEIQNLTRGVIWHHVPSKMNPVDKASRGQTPEEFVEDTIYLNGPAFLYEAEEKWPSRMPPHLNIVEETVSRKTFMNKLVKDEVTERKLLGWISMQRVFGYVHKFIRLTYKKKKRSSENVGRLDVRDLQEGTKLAVKVAQRSRLHDIIESLREKRTSHHILANLRPFLDEEGILRVGGRISNAEGFSYDEKFQMILPFDHWLTRSLFIHKHVKGLHQGAQSLLAAVRQQFWPIKGKVLANRTIHFCLKCRWVKPIVYQQIMGNLPAARLGNVDRPFVFVGADFAGPFYVKQKGRGRQQLKAYLCVFVCLVTKAVHLELVEDLSTDAFINTLERFAGRRGSPRQIWSDNGTNFMGARNKLRDLGKMLSSSIHIERIRQFCCVSLGADWHAIPVGSPHHGGIWESAVKIAKYHLVRALGNAALYYTQLETVMVMIEGVMNSRPLIPVSQDPRDDLPITPWHFINGGDMKIIPEPDLEKLDSSAQKRWYRVVALKQEIFRKYRRDYWHDLQTRYKWKEESPNPVVGQKVLVMEKNIPSLRWPWGIICSLSFGNDGKVRVVKIKMGKQVVERDIRNVCPLPFEDFESDSTVGEGGQTD